MTPEEKAKELLDKFYYAIDNHAESVCNSPASEAQQDCALIAVDEILNINSVDKDYDLSEFWLQVKQEIENYNK